MCYALLVTRYLKPGKIEPISYLVSIGVPHRVKEAYCFLEKVKVNCGYKGSNCENIVNTISHEEKHGSISHFRVKEYHTLRRRSLLVFVEVNIHLRSLEVKM